MRLLCICKPNSGYVPGRLKSQFSRYSYIGHGKLVCRQSRFNSLLNLGYAHFSCAFISQALEAAQDITGIKDNETKAKAEFMKILNSSDMFFTNVLFPPEESNDTAFKLCSTAEKAEKFCPNRWRAIQQWFTETREVIKRQECYLFI